MSATCQYCNQEMKPGAGCTQTHYDDIPGKGPLARIPYNPDYGGPDQKCHDCNVTRGQLHHPGCDMERCPACLGQAIGCGCSGEEEDDDEFD